MQYVTTDANGTITALADWPFPGSTLAKEEVIETEEGRFAFRSDYNPSSQPEEERLAALQRRFTDAIQARLDAFAQERGYDGILSACSYFGSGNPRFKAEADRAIALRDATWDAGYTLLDAVLSGSRPMPTLEEVFAELPALTWD